MSRDNPHLDAEPHDAPASPPGLLMRLPNAAAATLAAAALIALTGAGIAALDRNASTARQPAPPSPVHVATVAVERQPGYETHVRYAGTIEPARQTPLAFEQSGLVVSVLVEEGDAVAAGEVIARLDTRTLEADRDRLLARRRELEAQLALARLTRNRLDALSQRGWTPEQRQDEADTDVTRLIAAVAGVAAELSALDIRLAKSVLRAPFDGHITARAIDEGAIASPATPIATIAETARLRARIGLPPALAAGLDPARPVTIEIAGRRLPARLAATRPDVEAETRTIPVLFDLAPDDLAPNSASPAPALGALATLSLSRRIDQPGAWLPLAALKEGRRGLWTVLLVTSSESGSVVTQRAVEVLHVADERVYVTASLEDGARIVAAGTNRLVAGQHVALNGE